MNLSRLLLAFVGAVMICLPSLSAAEHAKDTLETVKKNVAQEKAVLIDVREPGEWKAGHIEGAQSLPLSELEEADAAAIRKQLPKNKIIYVHCLSGMRSLAAAEVLAPHGFDNRPLKPGYRELLKAGFKQAAR